MKINQQLFEDVLSCKLKGTFVLRGGTKIPSCKLKSNSEILYFLAGNTIYCDGRYSRYTETFLDVVDFIPDTDMKENELTIEIPKGKIVDWGESKKQNKIILKDKQLTYKDVCIALYKDKIVYYTDAKGNINRVPFSELDEENDYDDLNNATSKHQLECILAKNQLANVAKYLNNGWKPVGGEYYYHIVFDNYISTDFIVSRGTFLTGECRTMFKTKELAQQAIEILGEEIVKLALEPLGI